MAAPAFLPILYVRDVLASAAFWQRVLDTAPAEASPGFAMFVAEGVPRLGLWKRADVEPAAQAPGGGEFTFQLADAAALDAQLAAWQAAGATLLQPPTAMDFGLTGCVADPDGHRLRAFVPAP